MTAEEWQTYLDASSGPPGSEPPGLAWLPWLAAVRFRGAEARAFLQGYLTCDTTRLRAGTLTPTALCSLKGRVVMNGWCAPETDEDVLLVLHASLVDNLAAFLKPYLMFSRGTRLERLEDRVVLASLDLDTEDGLAMDPRRRVFVTDDLESSRSLWESHPHLTAEAWLAALTADGVALVSDAVSETFLPQMLNLDELGAIDFAKGCYLGQEVVARAQHRGQVKRRLHRLQWQGPVAPPAGGEVTDTSGRPVGVLVQSASHGSGAGPALAVLRAEAPEELRQGDVHLRSAQ